jgi:hypothetical protein
MKDLMIDGSIVSIEDINKWMHEKEVEYAAHHGEGYNRKLLVTLWGEWIVKDHGLEIFRGGILEAVEKYNSITRRYTERS